MLGDRPTRKAVRCSLRQWKIKSTKRGTVMMSRKRKKTKLLKYMTSSSSFLTKTSFSDAYFVNNGVRRAGIKETLSGNRNGHICPRFRLDSARNQFQTRCLLWSITIRQQRASPFSTTRHWTMLSPIWTNMDTSSSAMCSMPKKSRQTKIYSGNFSRKWTMEAFDVMTLTHGQQPGKHEFMSS